MLPQFFSIDPFSQIFFLKNHQIFSLFFRSKVTIRVTAVFCMQVSYDTIVTIGIIECKQGKEMVTEEVQKIRCLNWNLRFLGFLRI